MLDFKDSCKLICRSFSCNLWDDAVGDGKFTWAFHLIFYVLFMDRSFDPTFSVNFHPRAINSRYQFLLHELPFSFSKIDSNVLEFKLYIFAINFDQDERLNILQISFFLI